MTRTFPIDSDGGRSMSKIRVTVPIAIAAIAVAAFIGGNAFAANDTPHVTTLHYTLHFSPFTVIDVGAKGTSLGDEIVSHDVVFSIAGRRVGYDAQSCVFTSLNPPQLACSLVFAIPGGTIAGQYIGAPPPHKLVAITGGTGKYVGANGTIEVVESGHNLSNKNTLTFRLIP
jgi:hypothetical protein